MSYINPLWIADEHFEYLTEHFDLSKYDSEVDEMINAVCIDEGVSVPEFEESLDIDGFTTSITIKVYGKLLYKFFTFEGYWGKRAGSPDIYNAKLLFLEKQITKAEKRINRNTIITPTVETEVIPEGNSIAQKPY